MANVKSIRGGSVLVHLSEETNQLLMESSKRSGRSKTREAKMRLEDSLRSFSDLAATGRRFESGTECE
ncbi:TraY domain-containing protein [Pantoea vagans]|uniref:TraY domain-containing protein n=1 Tax=Pantoea vagans TaxID=470934 RepID=UPI0023B0C3C5|nr:TraY domain-containing protein [Pantoea vagans]MDE8558872.1 TraY domain-containing protein [Pantoea vagans]MDE8578877.1 TraY domain-containing protein [Pantoea vagans]